MKITLKKTYYEISCDIDWDGNDLWTALQILSAIQKTLRDLIAYTN